MTVFISVSRSITDTALNKVKETTTAFTVTVNLVNAAETTTQVIPAQY